MAEPDEAREHRRRGWWRESETLASGPEPSWPAARSSSRSLGVPEMRRSLGGVSVTTLS